MTKFEETGAVTDIGRPVHHRFTRSAENIAAASQSVAENQNVNSERYGHMITDFFLPSIEEYDLENMWFQQDGATCHTTRANMALLQETFLGRVISRRGDINWPPRSCDLTPLDFFLWGYAKDRVYADKPLTLEHLRTNIRQVVAEIPPNVCQKVVENYLKRINICNVSRDGHLNDVVFHT